MLYFEDAVNNNWMDIGTASIDDYYYKSLGFDATSLPAAKFRAVLDKLYSLLGNRGIKKLKGHEAIHLILLTSSLMNICTPSWESRLMPSFEDFRKESVNSKKEKVGEYWEKYVQWTMTSSDTKQSLSRRHAFFSEKMFELIKPIIKDSVRGFSDDERQIVYYRDKKLCGVCKSEISWNDLEIHHVLEHQHGGSTTLDNALSVHAVCHPKGQTAIDFAKKRFEEINP